MLYAGPVVARDTGSMPARNNPPSYEEHCSAPPAVARGNKSRSLLAAPDRCRCPTNLPHMERMLAAGLGVTRGTGFMPVSRVCRMAPDRYPTWVWCAAQDGPLTLLSPGRPPQPGTALSAASARLYRQRLPRLSALWAWGYASRDAAARVRIWSHTRTVIGQRLASLPCAA